MDLLLLFHLFLVCLPPRAHSCTLYFSFSIGGASSSLFTPLFVLIVFTCRSSSSHAVHLSHVLFSGDVLLGSLHGIVTYLTLTAQPLYTPFYPLVSSAKIIGGPSVYINSGATLQLSCLVNETPGPPDYIFWHHNGEVSIVALLDFSQK